MTSFPPVDGGASRRGHHLLRAGLAVLVLLVLLALQHDLVALVPARYQEALRLGIVGAAALVGAQAVRESVTAITRGLDRQAGVVLRNLSTWILSILLVLWIASTVGVNLSGLLLGGAVVGVVVATASQASLGNFFAGLVLMVGRPYRVGSPLRLRGAALGNVEYEGTVVDLGALYTTLVTASGETLRLPNSTVVTSAVVTGEAPLQAEVELELPRGTPLRPIHQALQQRLGEQRQLTITPKHLTAGEEGRLLCQVQVRSALPVDRTWLADALREAVELGSEGAARDELWRPAS
ncbi:MAG TPA: mechanosensitive ion channel family protein [Candidatus Dormibacteraeota bacterium]|nr:mechanosensitive ion channel family protein [Candidatus Dormibacteraeota bacterium]